MIRSALRLNPSSKVRKGAFVIASRLALYAALVRAAEPPFPQELPAPIKPWLWQSAFCLPGPTVDFQGTHRVTF